MNERQVQYEFKVIVRVSGDKWPGEVRKDIASAIEADAGFDVTSVERVRDGY